MDNRSRDERGRDLDLAGIRYQDGGYIVPSETGQGEYSVHLNDEDRRATGDEPPWYRRPECTCPDHQTRHNRCKHISAVYAFLAPQEALNGTYLDTTPGLGSQGNCGMTFWCTRHQRNETIEDAPWESQLRGVLWVDRCEGDAQLFDDAEQLPTPNEPDERLEPIYAALRRMGKEIADLRTKPDQTGTGRGATDA